MEIARLTFNEKRESLYLTGGYFENKINLSFILELFSCRRSFNFTEKFNSLLKSPFTEALRIKLIVKIYKNGTIRHERMVKGRRM